MKKLLIMFALMMGCFSYAQVGLVKAQKLIGITTAARDGLSISANQFPIIYNTTTAQFERYNGTSWETWVAGVTESDIIDLQDYVLPADIDTFAELDAIVADATLLKSGDNISTLTNDSGYITSQTDDQTASEVSVADAGGLTAQTNVEDYLAENRTAINLNTAKVTNATHTGEVTGSGALTIASSVVDSDNIVNGSIDETDLDASVNASLDLADGATQPADIDTFAELDAIVSDKSLAALNSNQTFTAAQRFNSSVVIGDGLVSHGVDDGVSGQRWFFGKGTGVDEFRFARQTSTQTDISGTASTLYTLDESGTPSSATDLIDKGYADANYLDNTDDQTASEITIADAGGLITETTVEGALQENRTAINLNTAKAAPLIAATDSIQPSDIGDGDYGDFTFLAGGATLDANTVGANELSSSGVTAGSYTNTSLTVDGDGRITAASNGTGSTASSQYNYNDISTSVTLDDNDVTSDGTATGKKIWNRVTATVDSLFLDDGNITTANLTGSPFIIQNWGADSTLVTRGPGTNFYVADSAAALVSNGIIIKQRHPVTFVKATATDFFVQGNFTTWVRPIGCTADPNEFYTTANAASDPNCNEANANTGWLTSNATVTSVSGTDTGSYSLQIQSTVANGYGYFPLTGEAATNEFSITFRARLATGTSANMYTIGTSPGFSQTITSSTWTTYSGTFTASGGSVVLRVFPDNESGAFGTVGDVLLIDNLSIVKTN